MTLQLPASTASAAVDGRGEIDGYVSKFELKISGIMTQHFLFMTEARGWSKYVGNRHISTLN